MCKAVLASISPIDSAERCFTGLGVRVIKGHATFKNNRTVSVDGKSRDPGAPFRHRLGIVAGNALDFPGSTAGPILTNESIFDIDVLAGRISPSPIGGGPIGMELAQAFRRLGAPVRRCARATRPLGKDDPECASIVCDQLKRDGVVLRNGVKVTFGHLCCGQRDAARRWKSEGGEEKIEGTHFSSPPGAIAHG